MDLLSTQIENQCPHVYLEFFDWFARAYNMNEYDFNSAPFSEQVIVMLRFLGQPIKLPRMPSQKINEWLMEQLKDYEILFSKYPTGKEDPLKKFANFTSAEIEKMFMENRGEIEVLKSLKDALVDRIIPEEESITIKDIQEDEKWTEYVKQSQSGEQAPF
jgi:hypothetical protein